MQGEPDWRCSVRLLLRGPFRLDAMQRAIQKLVDRHEALRTTISRTEPVQFIHPTLSHSVELIDLTHLTRSARDAAVAQWLSQQAKTPFDSPRQRGASEGPLMRSFVLKLEEERHLLAIDVHHIISDGWSINIILSELTALYNAACGGQAIESQLEAPHQYREFIEWQAQQNQSQAFAAQEAYWLDQFRAGFPVANLPTDHLPPQNWGGLRGGRSLDVNHRGSRYSARFDAKLTSQIKQMARAHKSTLFMTLLSGYGLLLHRLTGQEELVIGTPTAGRAFEHSEGIVGYCTHLLPIRSRCATQAWRAANSTVSEYLMALKKTIFAAYDHQDYPFARLLNKLKEQKKYPVVTTVFNLDRSPSDPDLFELQSEFLPITANFALVDFRLDVIEIAGELWLDYDYRTDLFSESTISRWHDEFQSLLKEMISNQ